LTENLKAVKFMSSKYKITKVLVATDSPGVLEELRARETSLDFIAIPDFDRSRLEESMWECARKHPGKGDDGVTLEDGCSGNDAWLEHRLAKGQFGGKELAEATLRDLLLMSLADAFVGQFSSNLSRLAYILAVLQQERMLPFWSLDGPWCYHWRMCCGVREDGTSSVC